MRRPCSTRLPRRSSFSIPHRPAVLGQRLAAAPLLLHPGVPLGGRHDHQLAQHGRVTQAAVLGAEDGIAAGRVGVEPGLGVAAGQRVLLEAQRRDVEGVDHVPRGEEQAHRPAGRDAEHVGGVGATRVGELPHPLLALNVDVHGPLGRGLQPDVLRVADGEVGEEEHERQADEDRLVDGLRIHDGSGLLRVLALVAEDEDRCGGQRRPGPQHGGDEDEVVEVVELPGPLRRLGGEEEELAQQFVQQVHRRAPFASRRQNTKSALARPKRTRRAPARTTPIA